MLSTFAQRLIDWQRRHGRHDLPWQQDWQRHRDPYRVWLAEIMLQQTQAGAVIPYYRRFVERFPSLASLAAAPQEEVMALWSGLGYYARARNLHACAQEILSEHGGRLPRDPAALQRLPGIGRSTANAIAAFCFGVRAPILDGNVKRLLCRHRGIEGFPGHPAVERRLWRDAETLLPKRDVPAYIQAQMDLGATICTRGKPRCPACPVAQDCVARREGRIAALPAPRPRRGLPERGMTLLVLCAKDAILLESRPPVGVWGALLSLPELPANADPAAYCAQRFGIRVTAVSPAPAFSHALTHVRLRIRPLVCKTVRSPQAGFGAGLRWATCTQIEHLPLPAPIRKILNAIP